METLETLLLKSRDGDRDAFAEIVRQYQGTVCGVAYSFLGDFHRSEDVAQETFLVVWNKLAELSDATKFPAWICSIARNLARNAARKKSDALLHHAIPLTENDQTAAKPEPDPQRSQIVWDAIENIPENYREPLVLFYRNDQSVRDIAVALDISEDAAKQRLSRARKHLKIELEKIIADTILLASPGEWFTLAVVAALPPVVLGTAAKTVLAATGATGAGAGSSAPLSPPGTIGVFAGSFFFVLAMLVPGLIFFWSMIRNSPTLRTRRYTLLVGSLVVWWSVLTLGLMSLFLTLDLIEYSDEYAAISILYVFAGTAAVAAFGFKLPCSGLLKKRDTWKKIYAEDLERPDEIAAALEESRWGMEPLVACLRRIVRSLFAVAIVYTAILYFFTPNIVTPCVGGAVLLSFALIYSRFVHDSLTMMRTDADLAKQPPMLPMRTRFNKTPIYDEKNKIKPLTPAQQRNYRLHFNNMFFLLALSVVTMVCVCYHLRGVESTDPRTSAYVFFGLSTMWLIGMSVESLEMLPVKRAFILLMVSIIVAGEWLYLCFCSPFDWTHNFGWTLTALNYTFFLVHAIFMTFINRRFRAEKQREDAGLPPTPRPQQPELFFDAFLERIQVRILMYLRSWLKHGRETFPVPRQVSRIVWPLTFGLLFVYAVIPVVVVWCVR